MSNFFKSSLLAITLLFSTSSFLIADNCASTECDQVMACEKQERSENNEKMTRLGKIRASLRNFVKPGEPIKAVDSTLDKIFGKETFSRKVASNAFPKILTTLTIKIAVEHAFDNLKIKGSDIGSWSKKLGAKTTSELELNAVGKVIEKITQHKIKECTDIVLAAVLAVWLTNK